MTLRCPETGYACSTSYSRKCRCQACVTWAESYYAARKSAPPRVKLAKPKLAKPKPAETKATPTVDLAKLRELARLADAAFRSDVHYAEEIAKAFWKQHPVRT